MPQFPAVSQMELAPATGRIQSTQLPLELVELIIEELHDSPRDLSSCGLVCRGWFHFAKSHVTIFLNAQNIPGFLDLVQSPTTTLFSSVRRLIIWVSQEDSQIHLPILQMLPEFTRLRSLLMWCSFPEGLPLLPELTELDLSGKFGSYSGFVSFMSNLPALQNLALHGVVGDDSPDPHLTFPTLELKTLHWGNGYPVEHVMFPLHTRRLILSFWPILSPNWLRSISKYLHHLGDHLRYLQLNCESDEQINCVSGLDFRYITGLQHLRIGKAVHSYVLATSSEVTIAPQLERLLARITPHCRLETLILGVETNCMIDPPQRTPFSQFAELMDAPQFAAVSEIQFVVNGSPFCLEGSARRAREHFESLPGILPSCPARRVVFIDGGVVFVDPDEVYW
ncbi:hypothetical protein B0H13DRAFT_2015263 [Mycena leptocephala]|nr:hypothetical protein B0H13DRAFT_2015263 [Mycena leptocephala]